MKTTKESIINMIMEKIPKNSKHREQIATLCDHLYCFGYQHGHIDTLDSNDVLMGSGVK